VSCQLASADHRLVEVEGEGMGPISLDVQMLMFAVLVVIDAIVVRRRYRWKWLVVFWLASAAPPTAFYVIWFWSMTPLSRDEALIKALTLAGFFFLIFLPVSGMLIWLVAVLVRPPGEPAVVPSEEIEAPHELLQIPRRYQALLTAYLKARQQAIGPVFWRGYVPGYVRQDFVSFVRLLRVHDVFRREFRLAAPLLAQLRELPTAELSALDAYHRMNLKYVRRRLLPLKSIGGFLSLLVVLSRALPSGLTTLEKWGMTVNLQGEALWASILAFGIQPWIWDLMIILGGPILGIIAADVIARRMQRRLAPFGDILTVALAYRQRESLATQVE
jgi:hypothetical protein